MLKKSIAALVCAAVSASVMTAFAAGSFSDVPDGHWAHGAIEELTDKGIINGVSDTEYQPEGVLTRAQFMKLLTCALGRYDSKKEYAPVFSDTAEDAWYTPYVSCGVSCGITDSVGGFFMPDEPMTRGEAAVWMVNGTCVMSDAECSFSDVTDPEQKKAVGAATAIGLINGYDDGTYKPDNTLTRAEAAALIQRMLGSRSVSGGLREDSANEVILKEGVKITSSGRTQNRVTGVDKSSRTVIFSDPDEVVSGLEKGDILYIPECEGFKNGLLVRVAAKRSSGSVVTVTCETPELGEVIDSVDISTIVRPSAEDFEDGANVTAATGMAGAGRLYAPQRIGRLFDKKENSQNGIDVKVNAGGYVGERNGKAVYSAYAVANETGKLHYETPGYADKKGVYAALDMELAAIVDLQISGEGKNVTLYAYGDALSDIELTAGYGTGGKSEVEFEMPGCTIPVAGPLMLDIDWYVTINASGEFNVECVSKIENDTGFSYYGGELQPWNNTTLDTKLTASAKGQIEAGPKIELGLQLGDLEKVGLEDFDILVTDAEFGLGVDAETAVEQEVTVSNSGAEYKGNQNTPDEKGVIHNCYLCIGGDIYAYDQFSFGFNDEVNELLKDKLGVKGKLETERYKHPLWGWHYSSGPWGGPEFELKHCPHKLVRVSGHVTDNATGKAISGANISCGDKNAITDADGRYELYLEPGTRALSAAAEGYRSNGAHLVNVPSENAATLDINLVADKVKVSGYVRDSGTGNAIANAAITSGGGSCSSDSNGYYSFYAEPGSRIGIAAAHDGYYDFWTELTVGENGLTAELKMDPKPEEPTATPEPAPEVGGMSNRFPSSFGNDPNNLNQNSQTCAFDEEYIYYYGNDGLYRMRYNGSGNVKLNGDRPHNMNIRGDKLYYSQSDSIYCLDLKTLEKNECVVSDDVGTMLIADKYLLYNTNESGTWKAGKQNATKKTVIGVIPLDTFKPKELYRESNDRNVVISADDEAFYAFILSDDYSSRVNRNVLKVTFNELDKGASRMQKVVSEKTFGPAYTLIFGTKGMYYISLGGVADTVYKTLYYSDIDTSKQTWYGKDSGWKLGYGNEPEMSLVTSVNRRYILGNAILVMVTAQVNTDPKYYTEEEQSLYYCPNMDITVPVKIGTVKGDEYIEYDSTRSSFGVHNDTFYFVENYTTLVTVTADGALTRVPIS